MERPAGTVAFTPSPEHYPFTSRWFTSSVGPVHYVDEGEGRPLLLMHGNPDWSFLYRHIIKRLSGRFRCIAADYPGFGLSGHPTAYGYSSEEHAEVIGELVDHLGLDGMVVMGQDWGGPIGLRIAASRADRVDGLVMGNTWFWPADDPLMIAFSRMMSTGAVQRQIIENNLFVDRLMPQSLQVRLSPEEFSHYQAVVPTPESRRGIAEFPVQILSSRPWMKTLQRDVRATLSGKPMLLLRGPRDPGLGRKSSIARWRATFPRAEYRVLRGAGHYFQEDAPDETSAAIAEMFAY